MNRSLFRISTVLACLALLASCGTKTSKQEKKTEDGSVKEAKLVGSDRDEHGCITSAGYQWSELLKDCIRPFEKGSRLKSTQSDNTLAAYLVFNSDSSKVELFIPKVKEKPILSRSENTSEGRIWIEQDNRYSVKSTKDNWELYLHNELQYTNE